MIARFSLRYCNAADGKRYGTFIAVVIEAFCAYVAMKCVQSSVCVGCQFFKVVGVGTQAVDVIVGWGIAN
jgi:hypothetical protein